MNAPSDDFMSVTRLWAHLLHERCKEDEAVELTCGTARGWMRVAHITIQNDNVATITGEDANGNFVERLCYCHALDLTATIVKRRTRKPQLALASKERNNLCTTNSQSVNA